MPSVTFSVPEEIKFAMRQLSWINWSELARQEILVQDERAELFEELDVLIKDSNLTDTDCLRFAKLVKEKFAKKSGKQ